MTESDAKMEPLGGRYEVGELVGRGGMADVRAGYDLRLGRPVAIKLLRADLAADETFQERFRREAQSAASLNHPSIVAVYDTGEATDASGATVPYIVMELVEGRTLRDVLRDGRKILPERALSITADILAALDYSHRAGIIHRDIKPANVMLTPEGKVKVMDFGIARAIADTSSAMTQTAAVIGTAQYLSPEQARGETVDARSDIYSTGCVLYELLTGRPPFVGDSPVSVAYQHVREEARPPSQLNPDVSVAVDHVVAKALAKRVDDRYSSAGEMRKDIERVLAGGSVDAPTQAVPVTAGATQVAPAVTAPVLPPPGEEEEKKGHAKWWALALVLLAIAAAIGVALMLNGGDEENAPPQVAVPRVEGLDVETATNRLESKNLTVGDTREQTSADIPEGQVMATDPEAGTTVDEGTAVDLVVSSGPELVDLPNLTSYSYDEAKDLLEGDQYGLKVKRQNTDSDQPKDRVLNSNPPPGSSVERGSTVTLIVSRGQVDVPNVVGQSADDARQALEDAGLKVSVQNDTSGTAPNGTVTAQSREPGSMVSPGTTITITVSRPPAPTTPTPTPTTEPTDDDLLP
ncbi:Stk1 family PASTA domain-containing Ser/Thr kinase [Aeromicrobium sp. 636]|uniref:non-specific serine/threonine protein kinase n=1 Tax=Aeromicrobium senzhongii TaxID=2663859 RepID=A0A8I0K391_9ACTN|nr:MULTISPECIES: Stk1 family PASTA domain-containing Ser/Thr kinase [Aeromicrobium]MBC9227005.1 Stk1 family PASTA domain-containing Ser/Thr kinase [Aeromicrobium senzhongii]MCQ3999105.1 Stk1 family PASTA domain-containing Ser/Thr kinase [Aeromicrobium sp. 636]MTB89393.1 Stk1 family PASTA domain-containing Ser/Thr kinase [Aeromicrobium senzhongii]